MTKQEIANQIHQPKPDADAMLMRDGFRYWCGTTVQKDKWNRLDIFFFELVTKKILTSWRRAEYDGWMITWLDHSNLPPGPQSQQTKDNIRYRLKEYNKKLDK